ncbi:MAG: Rrf2 family transcriptional regulator [Candidatus Fimivivens sp.]|nr:Rrf2 family transcriptional regulator [Candidatus Fimivivens sp.]
MRISAKGRYALAAVINMAQQYHNGEYITLLRISEKLGISKIYLEQVFLLLRRAELVQSVKGAQGGYQLTRAPEQMTVKDVLMAIEQALFEPTHETVQEKAPNIEAALRLSTFDVLDKAVRETLGNITIANLVNEAEKHKPDGAMMFYI